MNFYNNYNNNLKPLYNSSGVDFEIFFLNLKRYLKYLKILDIIKNIKILDLESADNSLQKIVKKKFDYNICLLLYDKF